MINFKNDVLHNISKTDILLANNLVTHNTIEANIGKLENNIKKIVQGILYFSKKYDVKIETENDFFILMSKLQTSGNVIDMGLGYQVENILNDGNLTEDINNFSRISEIITDNFIKKEFPNIDNKDLSLLKDIGSIVLTSIFSDDYIDNNLIHDIINKIKDIESEELLNYTFLVTYLYKLKDIVLFYNMNKTRSNDLYMVNQNLDLIIYTLAQHIDKDKNIKKVTSLHTFENTVTELLKIIGNAGQVQEVGVDGTLLYSNTKTEELSGKPLSELIGKNVRIFNSGRHPKDFWSNVWQRVSSGESFKGIVINKNIATGELVYLDTTITPIKDRNGKIIKYSVFRYNVTELYQTKIELEEKNTILKKLATSDGLTGLYNRRTLEEKTLKLIEEYDNGYISNVTCLFFDLDNFRDINNNHGHDIGDLVLKDFARIIQQESRDYDLAGRYGGEEFVLILKNLEKESGIESLLGRINKRLSEIKITEDKIGITSSTGIAHIKKNDTLEDLFKRSDEAMYYSKEHGKNRHTYYHQIDKLDDKKQ